jgi:hypothetical protein
MFGDCWIFDLALWRLFLVSETFHHNTFCHAVSNHVDCIFLWCSMFQF